MEERFLDKREYVMDNIDQGDPNERAYGSDISREL
jgi:hypothetical protein